MIAARGLLAFPSLAVTYLGCFYDNMISRSLPIDKGEFDDMTTKVSWRNLSL